MPDKPMTHNPVEIARDAFRQLAARRIAPTPEAYREAYDEIAGISSTNGAETVLGSLAEQIGNRRAELAPFRLRLTHALAERNWQEYGKALDQLVEKYLDTEPEAASAPAQPARPAAPATC
jgi:diguanylate cyclase